MKIQSAGIINGYIEKKFGNFAEEVDKIDSVPVRSIPVSWSELPMNTQYTL